MKPLSLKSPELNPLPPIVIVLPLFKDDVPPFCPNLTPKLLPVELTIISPSKVLPKELFATKIIPEPEFVKVACASKISAVSFAKVIFPEPEFINVVFALNVFPPVETVLAAPVFVTVTGLLNVAPFNSTSGLLILKLAVIVAPSTIVRDPLLFIVPLVIVPPKNLASPAITSVNAPKLKFPELIVKSSIPINSSKIGSLEPLFIIILSPISGSPEGLQLPGSKKSEFTAPVQVLVVCEKPD